SSFSTCSRRRPMATRSPKGVARWWASCTRTANATRPPVAGGSRALRATAAPSAWWATRRRRPASRATRPGPATTTSSAPTARKRGRLACREPGALPEGAQRGPVTPAARDARAIVHEQAGIARIQRLDLCKEVQVDDVAAMHTHEARWIEPFLNRGHRTQRVHMATNVQIHVVLCGLQPLDVPRCNQELRPELANKKALRAFDGFDRRPRIRHAQQSGFALQSQQQQS